MVKFFGVRFMVEVLSDIILTLGISCSTGGSHSSRCSCPEFGTIGSMKLRASEELFMICFDLTFFMLLRAIGSKFQLQISAASRVLFFISRRICHFTLLRWSV